VPNFGRRQTSGARYLCLHRSVRTLVRCREKVRDEILTRSDSRLFLRALFIRCLFEDQDAEIAGVIRADLESIGKPIGAYDLLIAGQAIRNKLTLITANLSEFARIKELPGQTGDGHNLVVARQLHSVRPVESNQPNPFFETVLELNSGGSLSRKCDYSAKRREACSN